MSPLSSPTAEHHPRRARLWIIPLVAAAMTIPVAGALEGPIGLAAGAILCRAPYGTLLVRVGRDLTRDQRGVGSASATCLCVEPAAETLCRWGTGPCPSVPVSTAATYATLLGISYALALAPAVALVALLRRAKN